MSIYFAILAASVASQFPHPIPPAVTDQYWHATADVQAVSVQLESANRRQQTAARAMAQFCGEYYAPAQMHTAQPDPRDGQWVCAPRPKK